MKLKQGWEKGKSPEEVEQVRRLLAELDGIFEENPLERFRPHSEQQRSFFEADTKVVAAFAGNRFGKTTSLVVRSLLECVAPEFVPERLRGYKRFEGPTFGWVVCPSNDKLYDSILPAFRKWAPRASLFKGGFDKAWEKQHRVLRFANGSWVAFKTYEMDLDKFGGAALHFVGFDEPPPRDIREECMTRLLDFGGYEMFAMTPLKSNTGWIRREIWKKREAPYITVVKGSMHDNPLLDKESKELALSMYASDLWRRAREFGDFVDIGGLIYAGFEDAVVKRPYKPRDVEGWDVVVGIDPGIRNAAFVWVGFDSENVAHVFDEALLQDKTPADYAALIRQKNARWGVKDALYVIDPAARSRAQVNAESVESELARQGVFTIPGQNQLEPGVQQVRTRLQHGRLLVSPECRGLRDEADEYAAEDRDDGVFKPIKENDHRLDALRYACMLRAWNPVVEDRAPDRRLGWVPGVAPAWDEFDEGPGGSLPLGSMS